MFKLPTLTRWRIIGAMAVALVADGLQLSLFTAPPFVWIIDVVAMALTMWLIGFHPLLLPTFVVELIPLLDALPTWTACTAAVIALQKRKQRNASLPVLPPGNPPVPPEP